MLRLLMDSMMVRRPLLEPNLNAAGLTFLASALLFFLMSNVITGNPTVADVTPAQSAAEIKAEIKAEEALGETTDTFETEGPGFCLL
jgi:hypothetical protein